MSEHRHDYAEFTVCRRCGLTEAAIEGCHHCSDTSSIQRGRCWWCLKPVIGAVGDGSARPQVLADLLKQWRAMVKSANETGPFPGDEIGHPSRWTAVEMCADELERALAAAPVIPGAPQLESEGDK